jgi:hypothetical protein
MYYVNVQLSVTIHSFSLITNTALSHFSQFSSHHNYSCKSLLTFFFLITTTAWSHYSQFFLSTPTTWSHYSQWFLITTTVLKSLFTDFITSQKKIKLYVTIHSGFSSQPRFWSHCSQILSHHKKKLKLYVTIHSFYLITTTVWSHCSQFLSHHNYIYESLFTVFFSHHNYSLK